MAKNGKKFRKHFSKGFRVPLAIVGGFVPGIIDSLYVTLNGVKIRRDFYNGGGDDVVSVALGSFLGIQTGGARNYYRYQNNGRSWSAWRLGYGLYPVLWGVAGHYLANKIGLNRAIGRLPVIGKWLSI